MTVERAIYVLIPDEMAVELSKLQEKADASIRLAGKLPAGDTKEIARSETLSALIEQKALSYAAADPAMVTIANQIPTVTRTLLTEEILKNSDHGIPDHICDLLTTGATFVVAVRPLFPGATESSPNGAGPRPSADSWKSKRNDGKGAEKERFRAVFEDALSRKGSKAAINPFSVSNRTLTETLRHYVQARPGVPPIDIPVEYSDGSTADHFPALAASLTNGLLPDWPVLRFTLMSIRHVEMDHIVDGAWFRNARISLHRPAGLTDADAFAVSKMQLAKIRNQGPRIIEMYQTGFQPAVTGFYRAVAIALIEHPGSLCVVPKFFVGEGFEPGEPWQSS